MAYVRLPHDCNGVVRHLITRHGFHTHTVQGLVDVGEEAAEAKTDSECAAPPVWMQIKPHVHNSVEQFEELAEAVKLFAQERAAASAAAALRGGSGDKGPASCVVYRSEQRVGMYLYVQDGKALEEPGQKLADVLALLGPLVDCGVSIDLTESRRLGQGGTTEDVRKRLGSSGFYLCRSTTKQ
jgi:uncharacterized protein YcgL (UPF0745 family)